MNTLRTNVLIQSDARETVTAAQAAIAALVGIKSEISNVDRVSKSAEKSARAMQNAFADRQSVDQLRQSMDPLYAATRRLETGVELLNTAQRRGSITAKERANVQELLTIQHQRATSAIVAQSNATRSLNTHTRGGAGGMQNLSFQLQDIFVQVGMGVPLLISLGQQAPQILSGFGTIGAMAGVLAAGILPLTAVIFGLGYSSRTSAEEIVTAEEMISDAISRISAAQSVLQETSTESLDAIVSKYGEVTASVLTLMQAQADLATASALADTKKALEEVFSSEGFDNIRESLDRVPQQVARLQQQLDAKQISTKLMIDTTAMDLEIAGIQNQINDVRSLANLQLELGVDEGAIQDIASFQEAIQSALAAENFEGALTVITQMRETLQGIPDGPLQEMFGGVVDVEDALRQALTVSEDNEEAQKRIAVLLETVGSVDVASNLAAGRAQAAGIADELGRAVANASQLANQGVGDVQRAQINFEFRDDAVGRAGALAGAQFDAQTNLPAGADSTIVNVIERERREFVGARVEAARYGEQLKEWQEQQREAARLERSAETAGGRAGRSAATAAARDAQTAARDRERTIVDIGRQLDRLQPSYERDLAAARKWRTEALANLNPALSGYEGFAKDVETIFGERLSEAYQEDLARRSDWRAGIERSFSSINDDMLSFADVTGSVITNWSSGLEDAFVSLGTTGKASVSDLVDFTLEQFLRLSYQQAVQPGLQGLFDFAIGSVLPGATTVANPGPAATIVQGLSATQSHFGSQIGTGGVRRTYGGNSPLRNDERLTVTTLGQRVFTPEQIANGSTVVDALATAAKGSGNTSANVTFSPNFSFATRSGEPLSGEVVEEDDGQGGRNFKVVFDEEIGSSLLRNGGGAQQALGRGYGLRKRMPGR